MRSAAVPAVTRLEEASVLPKYGLHASRSGESGDERLSKGRTVEKLEDKERSSPQAAMFVAYWWEQRQDASSRPLVALVVLSCPLPAKIDDTTVW